MEKVVALETLQKEIERDESLPLREATLVFGEGAPAAQVMFIGEAPGFHEDRLGRPFVGRGGKLLDECMTMIGWKRGDVYITNIVKRRPPENRDPLPEEIKVYEPYLVRQIAIIDPRIIVPLGRFAMNFFLPDAKISRDQGRVFEVEGRLIVPLFHPAAALRSTQVLEAFKASFRKLPDIVSGKYLEEVQKLPPATHQDDPMPPQARLF